MWQKIYMLAWSSLKNVKKCTLIIKINRITIINIDDLFLVLQFAVQCCIRKILWIGYIDPKFLFVSYLIQSYKHLLLQKKLLIFLLVCTTKIVFIRPLIFKEVISNNILASLCNYYVYQIFRSFTVMSCMMSEKTIS